MIAFIDYHRDVYGVCKVWRQMQREGFAVAHQLWRDIGLQGVIRCKRLPTSMGDKSPPCPLDQVNRQFRAPAPNFSWVSDYTYVVT
jgi:hypothetical protein